MHDQTTCSGQPLTDNMLKFLSTILFTVAISALFPTSGNAVQWQQLSSTTRYKVSYDEESVRLTPLGRLEVWLRFTPKNDVERKLAAAEYKDKRYRSHLEYYEIDCSDQTALLGLIDIFGASQARLNRLKGGTSPEPILPGSILESVMQKICPVLDEPPQEDGNDSDSEEGEEANGEKSKSINSDKQQRIERLKKSIENHTASAETWKELGNIYFDLDQPALAITAYDQALALQPNDTDVLNDQGAMFRQKGFFQRALDNFEKAFTIDPNNLESLYNSAYVYAFDLNNIPKAVNLWQYYLELESTTDTARQVQAYLNQYDPPAKQTQEK